MEECNEDEDNDDGTNRAGPSCSVTLETTPSRTGHDAVELCVPLIELVTERDAMSLTETELAEDDDRGKLAKDGEED